MKILIAEDDLVTREMLKRILLHMSDEIVEAGDGLEALEKIETEDPDFLFTDLQMPQLDGRALVEAVRGSREHSLLPIVCMSAVKDKEEITALVALGIQDYILKPIRPAEVHERFRKVISQHSGWRRRQAVEGRRTLMLVDPDANFREFARTVLESHFSVVEATSGAHALRIFKETEVKPALVVVAKGLPLVGEVQLTGLIGKLADGLQVRLPEFWLCSEDEAPSPEVLANFAGHLKRTFVADTFTTELKRTLLHGMSPADQLADYLRARARNWLISATRQTLGVMLGQEVTTDVAEQNQPIEGGLAGQIRLSSVDAVVTLSTACSRKDALALAAAVLRSGPDFNDDGKALEVFLEFSNTIAGRARTALSERGFDLEVGPPDIVTDSASDPSATWDLSEWFQTDSGSRFFVGLASAPGDGKGEVPRAEDVAAEPVGTDAGVT